MGSITTRKCKDGSSRNLARVRVMRGGTSYHETKAFDRCPTPTTWIKKRGKERARPWCAGEALPRRSGSDPE